MTSTAAPMGRASKAGRRSGRRWVVAAAVAAIFWFALAILGTVGLASVAVLGDAACEKSESNYGKLSWSTIPPGPVCTWTTSLNGVDEVAGPGPIMSLWLVSLGVLGGGSIWLVRRAYQETDPYRTDSDA